METTAGEGSLLGTIMIFCMIKIDDSYDWKCDPSVVTPYSSVTTGTLILDSQVLLLGDFCVWFFT
jgi:hypothetical protein